MGHGTSTIDLSISPETVVQQVVDQGKGARVHRTRKGCEEGEEQNSGVRDQNLLEDVATIPQVLSRERWKSGAGLWGNNSKNGQTSAMTTSKILSPYAQQLGSLSIFLTDVSCPSAFSRIVGSCIRWVKQSSGGPSYAKDPTWHYLAQWARKSQRTVWGLARLLLTSSALSTRSQGLHIT